MKKEHAWQGFLRIVLTKNIIFIDNYIAIEIILISVFTIMSINGKISKKYHYY